MAIDRRALLVGGGAAIGLVIGWRLWPRAYPAGLPLTAGEQAFDGWLKIGIDGHVVVAVPQCEHGQGVYTALPQIVADELGADWRTVGVEAAPENPRYANPIGAEAVSGAAGRFDGGAPMLTAGSSSVRAFEAPLRHAGAAARVLLCKAAARRLGGDWRTFTTADGFVVAGKARLRFGDLVGDAVAQKLPSELPPRGEAPRLTGRAVPRLDSPAKVDGSANFAGDVRLPNMVFAAIRQGPLGGSRLTQVDHAAAARIPGVLRIVENRDWVAVVGTTWWAANRALGAIMSRFETPGPLVDDAQVDRALAAALGGAGIRIGGAGDIAATFRDARVLRAEYRTGFGVAAAIEPVTATARFENGKLTLWLATLLPGRARAAAAATIGLAEDRVVLHPMIAGGSFGANLEVRVAEQAALLAYQLKVPVQLTWSRAESLMQTPPRPPARARMTARMGAAGIIGWHAAIATPSLGHELRARLLGSGPAGDRDPVAVDGAAPAYRIPNWALDHHPAAIGVPAGWSRSGAHFASAFFTESFLDELARGAGLEPLSFRIAMLGGDARLARCLSTVASLGGWQGGVPGSGQGIACHSFRGSRIALMVEAGMADGGRPRIDRMVAAVDCGRMVNPDLVRQAIEGGLIFGMAAATGAATGFTRGLGDARSFRDLGLPRLADSPDITVELIASDAEPGGASELAVPVVGPALANALFAATGRRLRALPL